MLTVRLFEALSPPDFAALRHLEIKDANSRANSQRLTWDAEEFPPYGGGTRFFSGLVQQFLCALPGLVSLWVDEQALLPAKGDGVGLDRIYTFCGVAELFNEDSATADFGVEAKAVWRECLKVILGQVESLRVGFGVMNAAEVGLILGYCDPAKLRQFGFTWAWKEYGRDEVSATLPLQSINPLLFSVYSFPH